MWPLLALSALQMISGASKEDREKKLAAATQRYSPWTGLKAQPVNYADPAGTIMQAYGASQAMGQAQTNQANQQKLLDAQTNYFNSMAGGGGPGGATASNAAAASAMSPYAAAQGSPWTVWGANGGGMVGM